MRIGALLVEQGVLSAQQVEQVLAAQRETGEPFGAVCERLFGLSPQVIEGAWAEQYSRLVGSVDPRLDEVDDAAEALVTRRQAWQFRVAPLRFEDDQLVMVTSTPFLPRAVRFATSHIAAPVYFLLVRPDVLAQHLQDRYPMLGMDAEIIQRGFAA